jgi:hypothetical protein
MNSCSDLKVSIMTEKDQGKFARKAQRILHRDQPMSLADLMSEEEHEPGFPESREAGYPESQEPGYPDTRIPDRSGSAVREEFRLPEDLADTLREYAHQQRLKKTAVVIEALQEFFRHRNFSLPK